MSSTGRDGRRRLRSISVIGVTCLVLAACGNRVGREEVIRALGPDAVSADASATGNADASETPSGVATTVAPGIAGGSSEAGTAVNGAGATASDAPAQTGPAGDTGGVATEVDPSLPPVILGNIGEYSGPVGASLGGARPMASVLEQWYNDNGGLDGHRVRIIVADNQGDPSRYLALVRDMVENQGVIAFVGNQVPLTAPGADQYLRERGIPVVGGEGAATLWFTSPVMFFAGSTWSTLWIGTAGIAARRGAPKLSVFHCREAESCRTGFESIRDNEEMVRAQGAELVHSAQVSIVQPDFTAECLAARNAGAQAIISPIDANSWSRIARSCRSQGYTPLFLTSGPAVVNSLADDPNFDGTSLLAASPVFPWLATDTPAAQAFNEAIQTYNPSMENSGAAAQVWAGGMLLRLASGNLSANPTSAEIIAGLHLVQNETLGGLVPPLSFPHDQPRPVISCYFVIELTDDGWTAPQGSETACL